MPCTDQPIGRGWVLGLLIAVGACAGGETVGTDAQHDGSSVTVRISPPVDSLGVGETRRLTIAVTDEDGTRRSAIVKWKSANPAIATVGKAGDVIALAEGAVAIVATVGSRSDTASIYVRPGNLSIEPNAVNSVVGEAVRFSATASAARDTSSLRVTWSSSNTNVAVVDPDGTVSMVGQGEAILTATAGARTGTASVSVHQRDIASLRVTPATSTMYPNDSAQLHIAAFDDAGRAMALVPGNVQWSSSDSRVVTVTDGGVVTAQAAGSAVVTVHIGSKTATAAINVQGLPVSSVFVSLETGTLEVGQVTKAKATLADADGTTLTGRAVAWQSSNPAIATGQLVRCRHGGRPRHRLPSARSPRARLAAPISPSPRRTSRRSWSPPTPRPRPSARRHDSRRRSRTRAAVSSSVAPSRGRAATPPWPQSPPPGS
jgi:uncharacterized protein YjdB